MKIEKLIPMEDFVIKEYNDNGIKYSESMIRCHDYAQLLKQEPELWMFVPCDEDGKVISKPDFKFRSSERWGVSEVTPQWNKYQTAKQRCLFEGFEVVEDNGFGRKVISLDKVLNMFWWDARTWVLSKDVRTISYLTKFNLPLTKTAINNIYNP